MVLLVSATPNTPRTDSRCAATIPATRKGS